VNGPLQGAGCAHQDESHQHHNPFHVNAPFRVTASARGIYRFLISGGYGFTMTNCTVYAPISAAGVSRAKTCISSLASLTW